MEQGNFTNLSWDHGQDHGSSVTSPRGEAESGAVGANSGRSDSTSMQAGRGADDLDMAGVGSATLECTVTQPMKENDGTKDAYVSYLVTTHVCSPSCCKEALANMNGTDYLPILCETNYDCETTLHGFCVPLQDVE
jgi:sorting nexin-4